jgi:hypothetical protein
MADDSPGDARRSSRGHVRLFRAVIPIPNEKRFNHRRASPLPPSGHPLLHSEWRRDVLYPGRGFFIKVVHRADGAAGGLGEGASLIIPPNLIRNWYHSIARVSILRAGIEKLVRIQAQPGHGRWHQRTLVVEGSSVVAGHKRPAFLKRDAATDPGRPLFK